MTAVTSVDQQHIVARTLEGIKYARHEQYNECYPVHKVEGWRDSKQGEATLSRCKSFPSTLVLCESDA